MGKGGVSKSLASLLCCIDYSKYNVDLFLFSKSGLFLEQVPPEVHILDELPSPYSLLKKGRVFTFTKWALSVIICKSITSLEKKWRVYWILNKSRYPLSSKRYDVGISYNDGVELYYLVDRVDAIEKIGYNHIQYTNVLTYKPNLDSIYYKEVNYIVTVSDLCAVDLKNVFPDMSSKIRVVENIVLKEQLWKMAGNEDPYVKIGVDRNSYVIVCTVAGLFLRKGFDFSSAALRKMKDEGKTFKWFILGTGPEQEQVQSIIRQSGIEKDTVFMYEQKNPYKYVRYADIFLLTSHAEGKSIAVEEAKLLEKPILITRYSTADNQIEHGKSGLIADMNIESVTNELRKLFDNKQLCESLSSYLKSNCHSNKEENLMRLYALL